MAPLSPSSLNRNLAGQPPSATLAINERSNELIRQGRRIFKFGLGQSPFPVPPMVVAALQAAAHEKDYLPARGLPALREAVADYLQRRQGLRRAAQQVIVGPGSKELMFLLQLAFAGELLLPSPSWVSYAPQARLLGRQTTWLPTDLAQDYKLQPGTLDAHCAAAPAAPRLLILNYPNNPTGVSYTDAELAALGAAARRHNVLVLADEIYGDLDHAGAAPSIARHYPEGTVVSTGLSKWCGAGGWRLGVFSFPPELEWLAAALAVAATETFTAVSAPIQHAAVCAFRGGTEIERYLTHCRTILRTLGSHGRQTLEQAGGRLPRLDGGFYLFPDFSSLRETLGGRGLVDSPALVEKLLEETGVATLPGTAFGRPPGELTLRLSYVNFDGAAALRAAESGEVIDGAFLWRHCADSVEAFARMARWFRPS